MKHKILVVDDSKTARMVERLMLQGAGKEVTVCDGADEAMKLLAGNTYDMMICDQEMPMMTGFELLQAVRKNEDYSHMSIIVFTSWLTDKLTEDCKIAGADACVTKNEFQKEDFIGMIGSIIDGTAGWRSKKSA